MLTSLLPSINRKQKKNIKSPIIECIRSSQLLKSASNFFLPLKKTTKNETHSTTIKPIERSISLAYLIEMELKFQKEFDLFSKNILIPCRTIVMPNSDLFYLIFDALYTLSELHRCLLLNLNQFNIDTYPLTEDIIIIIKKALISMEPTYRAYTYHLFKAYKMLKKVLQNNTEIDSTQLELYMFRPLELLMAYKYVLQKFNHPDKVQDQIHHLNYLQSLIYESKTVITAYEQISNLEKELNLVEKNISLTDKHRILILKNQFEVIDFKWVNEIHYNLDKVYKLQCILLSDKFLLTTCIDNNNHFKLITICNDLNLLFLTPLKSRAGDPYGTSLLVTIKGVLIIKLMANNADIKWNFINKLNVIKQDNNNNPITILNQLNLEKEHDDIEFNEVVKLENKKDDNTSKLKEDTNDKIINTINNNNIVMNLIRRNSIQHEGNLTNIDKTNVEVKMDLNQQPIINNLNNIINNNDNLIQESNEQINESKINIKYLPSLPSSLTTNDSHNKLSESTINYVKDKSKIKSLSAISLSYLKTSSNINFNSLLSKSDITNNNDNNNNNNNNNNKQIQSRSSSTIQNHINNINKLGISKYLSLPCELYIKKQHQWYFINLTTVELREIEINNSLLLFNNINEDKSIIKLSIIKDQFKVNKKNNALVISNNNKQFKLIFDNQQELDELYNLLLVEQQSGGINDRLNSIEEEEEDLESNICLANLSFKLYQLHMQDHTWTKIGKSQLELYQNNSNVKLIVKNLKKDKILLNLIKHEFKVERKKLNKIVLYHLDKANASNTFLLVFKSRTLTENLLHWLI